MSHDMHNHRMIVHLPPILSRHDITCAQFPSPAGLAIQCSFTLFDCQVRVIGIEGHPAGFVVNVAGQGCRPGVRAVKIPSLEQAMARGVEFAQRQAPVDG